MAATAPEVKDKYITKEGIIVIDGVETTETDVVVTWRFLGGNRKYTSSLLAFNRHLADRNGRRCA